MAGLNQQDMDVLKHYAVTGNRVLYWNYLAQHPGNDGYGLLALGVVRNDSMPGAVANSYAQMQAVADGRHLSERDWEKFGQDLIQQDFALRLDRMATKEGHVPRPELALNLPIRDVQKAHDKAFENARIDPNAWTPRQLLEAARRNGTEADAQKIWHTMLDSSALGARRLGFTTADVIAHEYDRPLDAFTYLGKLTLATGTASRTLAHNDPDKIGTKDLHAQYFPKKGTWYQFSDELKGTMAGAPTYDLIKDRDRLRELDDARAVRLERQEKAMQFDAQDPYRTLPIRKSPFTIADNGHGLAPATQLGGLSHEPSPPRGSTDDLFIRLTDAAMARDGAAMRGVSQEFLVSTSGQEWLQAGREHNQAEREAALAAQQAQAMAEQAVMMQAAPRQSGPVMCM
jgi:hypothetical protein